MSFEVQNSNSRLVCYISDCCFFSQREERGQSHNGVYIHIASLIRMSTLPNIHIALNKDFILRQLGTRLYLLVKDGA